MTAALEIEGVRTHIERRGSTVRAVDGVSFSIASGETLGLVGESGSGKSMIGLSILQLLPPGGRIVAGSIRVGGQELVGAGERTLRSIRGAAVGMVFQDPMTSLNPTMTIGRQLMRPIRRHLRASSRAARERAAEMLELVGMPSPRERLGDYPHQLSGGMRQRAMIAMALACEPKLLIADEPTTALDVTVQEQVLELIDDLKARLQMGVLLITHDMGVIAGHADRVAVMYAGELVEAGDAPSIFGGMRHRYTEALLDSIVDLDQPAGAPLLSIPGSPPDLTRPLDCCPFSSRCRHALPSCHAERPPMEGSSAHRYACFNPVAARATATPRMAVVETSSQAPGGPRPDVLIEVSHLVKEFRAGGGLAGRRGRVVHAVSDVSFEVYTGEVLGLVGESGSGKTTIAQLMVGLQRPTGGAVRFSGVDVTRLNSRSLRQERRELQLMFQDPYASLDPRMSIEAILREPLAIQAIGSRSEQRERVCELLVEVGLSAADLDRYPHEFSGGQRQRIGLARSLALNPRVVVADEPVSALDVSVRAQILNLMKRLRATHQLTYVVISHDLAVVKYLVDRIGVFYLGKLVELGPTASVTGHPAHPYTQSLIEAVLPPDPARARARGRRVVQGEPPSAIDPPSGCRFRTRCLRAQDICATVEPPLRTFQSGQVAACHFPLQAPG